MLQLRKPTIADVSDMLTLMAPEVRAEALLPRSRRAVIERLRDYVVAEDHDGLVGLASLSLISDELAELGALVSPAPSLTEALIAALFEEARDLGVRRAFVLAPDPAPFEALGFAQVALDQLAEKRDRQCLRCPRLPRCRQIALIQEIPPVQAARSVAA
ncbi:MAG: hypothetical protein H6739_21230 [Alphaproteobacteria bacterium]|nr:hypothetical protein [Alphaproteobacteria bacterium]